MDRHVYATPGRHIYAGIAAAAARARGHRMMMMIAAARA
eukprot:SAG31_NODE_22112_length_533_cov_1.308756_1_plen_38_part_10